MARILVETKALPLVVVTFPREAVTDAALREFLTTVDTLVGKSPKIAIVVDFSLVEQVPNASQRALLTQWMAKSASRNREAIVGTSLVVRSAVLRGAITAVHWVRKPVTPQHVATNVKDACAWCAERLRAAGAPVDLVDFSKPR